ncbi:LysR substrate-binding domain-containing protein [Streptomyces noursei]|uniref:LysR substrate-binding domain-containing protein n=1 Tax=Streptomyces noursei TaxID=1971 RepID=UPI00215538E1|nr:LysR substrate-binding domain-containing protein [Streptomyces noursei]
MELPGVQLRTLLELTRSRTMTAAAAALGYTPGAVSQHIAALERSTGSELVRRVGRRVELTDAGRTLAEHAERILGAQAEAVAALERARGEVGGHLRLGVFGTAAAVLLPPALRRLAARHPAVRVASREVDVDQAYVEVLAGRVDLALGLDYPDAPLARDGAVELVRLRTERFSLAVPAGAAGAGRAPLALAEAGAYDWILPTAGSYYGRAIRTACRRAGCEPRVVHEVTDTATSLAMVGAGLGVAPLTGLMLRLRSEGIAVVPLRETVERHIVVAVGTAARARPSVAALIAALRAGAESGAGSEVGSRVGPEGVGPEAERTAGTALGTAPGGGPVPGGGNVTRRGQHSPAAVLRSQA